MTAIIPCLFTLGAVGASCAITSTCRAYAPTIRATLREAIEG